MNAESIARALGGHRAGSTWMARCPAHEDREPSLSIRGGDDGRVLVYCHAGCEQAQVIASLRSRGLWSARGQRNSGCNRQRPNGDRDHDNAGRKRAARAIWEAAAPAGGTLVDRYLASRGCISSRHRPCGSMPF